MLELEHEVIAEEGQDHWVFLETCRAVLQASPPKAHGVVMYCLQLLTGNVSLAAILGMLATTPQLATAEREPMSTASPPTVSETPAPSTGTKWQWCSSNQEATMLRPEEEEAAELDITPKEWPHQRWKERRPWQGSSKTAARKPLGKTLNLSKWLGRHILRCTIPTITMRGPMTSPTPSRRWPPPLAS